MREQIKEYIKEESQKLVSKILQKVKEETNLNIIYELPPNINTNIVNAAAALLIRSGWVVKREITSIRIGPKED